jgi:hypothetical protein
MIRQNRAELARRVDQQTGAVDTVNKSIADKEMKSQSKAPKDVRDPVADALVAALDQFKEVKTFRLGAKGYVVKRSKGKGASGFIAQKIT